MSDLPQNDQKQENAPQNEQTYSFYWDYRAQVQADRTQKAAQSKRGARAYAIIMASVFAFCFLMLAAVIVWYQYGEQPVQSNPAISVSQEVTPATVLIYATAGIDNSYGTGFFIQEDGYIVTNYHVVAKAGNITVTTYDGKTAKARVVGYVETDDIAVIKIDGSGYPTVSYGNSDQLVVGEPAIAVGNPGGDDGAWSTTQGIVSHTERWVSVEENFYMADLKMIQVDTPVNPGNSGGPLCNANGEVIGIVTRKLTGYEAIGYAIPINEARQTIDAIMEGRLDGFVSSVSKSRPKIGVGVLNVRAGDSFKAEDGVEYTAAVDGVTVLEIDLNSSAYGKLKIGDVICAMNEKPVENTGDLQAYLYDVAVGEKVAFTVSRQGSTVTVEIVLGVSK